MEYQFKKYQFPSEAFYRELLTNTEVSVNTAFVELGMLVEGTYSVDALWVGEAAEGWKEWEITDVEGNGAHTFMGWNFNQD